MVICVLIMLSVPPIYLLDTFVPPMVGAPLIAGIALWKSVGLMASGGDLDKAYDLAGRAMASLGLSVTERPAVSIEPKGVAPFRVGSAVHGELVFEGVRHGRAVTVRIPADGGPGSEVRVDAESPAFELRARAGRLSTGRDAPPVAREVLRGVPSSTRWSGVRGDAKDGAISVRRKRSAGSAARGDWLLDLWLAERLADAVSGPVPASRA